MSNLHKHAMEAVLAAAKHDIDDSLKENGIDDPGSEDANDITLDVAILHAYRIFVRICEQRGLTIDPALFADMADELCDEMAQDIEE
ncbi:conserved hypothetical protein [uncultured Gammaproteobacteria bacterium]